jgi:hypothetical protein
MNDDELLQRLDQALVPKHHVPPAASVLALRRAVSAGPPVAAGPARLPWWRHRVAAAGVVFATVLGGSSAAFALGGAPLPRPIRVVCQSVGLPVDSVALADTKSAMGNLRAALKHHNPARVEEAARVLRARLSHLDQDERGDVQHETSALLQEANQVGDQGDQQGASGPSAPPVRSPAGSQRDQGTPGPQNGKPGGASSGGAGSQGPSSPLDTAAHSSSARTEPPSTNPGDPVTTAGETGTLGGSGSG